MWLKSFMRSFYPEQVRKIFESGVLGIGRSGYMKRQYFFVPPNTDKKVINISVINLYYM